MLLTCVHGCSAASATGVLCTGRLGVCCMLVDLLEASAEARARYFILVLRFDLVLQMNRCQLRTNNNFAADHTRHEAEYVWF